VRRRGVWLAAVTALTLTCTALAACGPSQDEPEAAAEPDQGAAVVAATGETVLRGFIVLGHEVRSIKPCGEERELWVIPVADLSAAYEELSSEPYDPVFVEVEGRLGPPPETGFGADFDGLLTVTRLRRAAPAVEGAGCSEDVSGFAFRAAGQEPFWHLHITPGGMVYTTPEIPETRFAAAEPYVAAGGWVYESSATGPEPLSIRATFEPGRCQDTMVGVIYSWSATVELAGEVRRGCAWQGTLAPGAQGPRVP
jgi:putative lipoprotein